MYIPATVKQETDDGSVIVGWLPAQGFCVDLGTGEFVVANNPLDATRISAALSAMPDLYKEASRLRDSHADLLDESAQEAEEFLQDITEDREPEEEPPEWPP